MIALHTLLHNLIIQIDILQQNLEALFFQI